MINISDLKTDIELTHKKPFSCIFYNCILNNKKQTELSIKINLDVKYILYKNKFIKFKEKNKYLDRIKFSELKLILTEQDNKIIINDVLVKGSSFSLDVHPNINYIEKDIYGAVCTQCINQYYSRLQILQILVDLSVFNIDNCYPYKLYKFRKEYESIINLIF